MVQENIELLVEGQWSAFSIESYCPECKRDIAVTLGWHNGKEEFSKRPVLTEGEKLSVTDDIDLSGRKSQ